jgi:hypothetical protein
VKKAEASADDRIEKAADRLSTMTEESIRTIEAQTAEFRKDDKWMIAPPEELAKIAATLQKIGEIYEAAKKRRGTDDNNLF